MRLRIISSIIFALAASACSFNGIAPSQSAINAQIESQIASGNSQTCEMLAQQVAPTCGESSVKSLTHLMVGDVAAKNVESAKVRCDMSPTGRARSKELEGCIERLLTGTATERELQQARLPAERTKVPEVRAEPGFAALAEEYKSLDHEVLAAGDDLKAARAQGNPNAHRYQQRYDEVSAKHREVRLRINKIYEGHGIDARDAQLLGLL